MKSIRKVLPGLSRTMVGTVCGAIVGVATVSSAQGATGPQLQAMAEQYAGMCANQGVTLPAPYGESDLKGNPKLQDYCKCFGNKFAERAIKSAQDMAVASAQSTKDSVKEEWAMRNSCRQTYGLPLVKSPS